MIPKYRKILYVCMALLVVAGQVKLHLDRTKRKERKERERSEHLAAQAAPHREVAERSAHGPTSSTRNVSTFAASSTDVTPRDMSAAVRDVISASRAIVPDGSRSRAIDVAAGRRSAHGRSGRPWPADPFWPRTAPAKQETSAGGDSVAPDVKLGDMIPVMEEDSAGVGHDVLDADHGPGSTTANGRALSEPSEGGAR